MTHIQTLAIHAGYSPKNGEPSVLPIAQSTTFRYTSTDAVARLFDLQEAGFFYTRLANPTTDAVEKKIAALEGGVGAMPATTLWRVRPSTGAASTCLALL